MRADGQRWALLADPETYGWQELLRDGKAVWDGIKNSRAQNNLKKIQHANRQLAEVREKIERYHADLKMTAAEAEIARIAGDLKMKVEDAGRTYYAVGEAFHLDWLRAGARALIGDSHWDRLAVFAIIEDLYGHQRDLTISILAHAKGAIGADAIAGWRETRGAALARGDSEKAARWANDAVTDFRERRDPRGLAASFVRLGRAYAGLSESDRAAALLQEAAEIADRWGYRTQAAEASRALASLPTSANFGE